MALLLHLRNEKNIIRQADSYDKTGDATKGGREGAQFTTPKHLVIFFSRVRVL